MKSTDLPRPIILRLFRSVAIVPFALQIIMLCGCQELTHNTRSLLLPRFQRSDIFGFVAGLGTTFAVFPDLVAMLRRRSTAGMNPRMAAIIGCFQVLWVYYGILITSRPVVAWNVIGVLITSLRPVPMCIFAAKKKPGLRASGTADGGIICMPTT